MRGIKRGTLLAAAAAVEKRRNRISRRRDVLDDLYKRPVPKIQCQHVQQHIRPAFSFAGSIDSSLYKDMMTCVLGCWTGVLCVTARPDGY